ncbi:MAG: ParB/RepB/Spo0J family partition protein [Bacteroidia bacterium]|nr:ParB/RepB/Spo0J family partition protein [Bacteroidia bacterium]MCZ2276953.1 ParB/RepB/Spo0J family partition protein [Bacteroidia bacterium]
MNTKRNALGRGLSALLDPAVTDPAISSEAPVPGLFTGGVSSILIEKIKPNPFQPRNHFEETSLKELADSIRLHGVIQPITVRKLDSDHYQIISGERRWRASKLAGLDYIPAYVRIANDEAMLEMAIVENIQREELNPIEVATSFQRLVDEVKLSHEQLAERVGKDRSTVTNFLRLLKLPPLIQAAIRDKKLTMGHARALISINDVGSQLKLFNEIMKGKYSVRDVEELVRQRKGNSSDKKTSVVSPEYKRITDRLSQLFETKVNIQLLSGESGNISIRFYSTDDLNRILDMLDV